MTDLKAVITLEKVPVDSIEIADIDGTKYYKSDKGELLEDTGKAVTVLTAASRPDYPGLIQQIKKASPQCQDINTQVVAKIRERYSVDEEIGILRTGKTAEFDEWNNYVEGCLSWGREEKAKLGL